MFVASAPQIKQPKTFAQVIRRLSIISFDNFRTKNMDETSQKRQEKNL